ncbi:hypothetical protein E2F47_10340 [Mycobacterium eburneum]|nr:hypothetical protein [Mycobacterium eburneum]TDH55120.1 hypothetical protein E2F47_10340 [Mycobacterium eburneum]
MGEVFVGSEAIEAGLLTDNDLRRRCRPIFRGVYIPRQQEPSLRDRTVGAWLRTRRRGVIAGVAASALHGARWVDADTPIELIAPHVRPQRGLVVRDESLGDDEVTKVAGLPVTTAARTAYDLGRHLPRNQAIARLDALTRATPFSTEDVLLLAKRHLGARGVQRLRAALPLVDGGAASPRETWLRLLLIDAGFPVPCTQIPVVKGPTPVAFLDMGWKEFMVAAEYDGDQHRTDRASYRNEHWRREYVDELGWLVVRVIKEDRPDYIIERVDRAMRRRGWHPDRRFRAKMRVRRTET